MGHPHRHTHRGTGSKPAGALKRSPTHKQDRVKHSIKPEHKRRHKHKHAKEGDTKEGDKKEGEEENKEGSGMLGAFTSVFFGGGGEKDADDSSDIGDKNKKEKEKEEAKAKRKEERHNKKKEKKHRDSEDDGDGDAEGSTPWLGGLFGLLGSKKEAEGEGEEMEEEADDNAENKRDHKKDKKNKDEEAEAEDQGDGGKPWYALLFGSGSTGDDSKDIGEDGDQSKKKEKTKKKEKKKSGKKVHHHHHDEHSDKKLNEAASESSDSTAADSELSGKSLWDKLKGLVGGGGGGGEGGSEENDDEDKNEAAQAKELMAQIAKAEADKYVVPRGLFAGGGNKEMKRRNSIVYLRAKAFQREIDARSPKAIEQEQQQQQQQNQILAQTISWMQTRIRDTMAHRNEDKKAKMRIEQLKKYMVENKLDAFSDVLVDGGVGSLREARRLTSRQLAGMGVASRESRHRLVRKLSSAPLLLTLEDWDCKLCGLSGQPIDQTKCSRCQRTAPSKQGILNHKSAMVIQNAWRVHRARKIFRRTLRAMRKARQGARRKAEAKRKAHALRTGATRYRSEQVGRIARSRPTARASRPLVPIGATRATRPITPNFRLRGRPDYR